MTQGFDACVLTTVAAQLGRMEDGTRDLLAAESSKTEEDTTENYLDRLTVDL